MSDTPTAQRLAQLALFADLEAPTLERLAHTFDEQVFGDGERVLRRGLSGGSFYVILEGAAVVRAGGGDGVRLGSGDFFGEVSALLGDTPSTDVVASGILRCLVIPGPQLEEFLLENPRVMLRLLRAEARRLSTTVDWERT